MNRNFNEQYEPKKTRIRTIRESVAAIKEMDSDTAVTYNLIRQLCAKKEIAHINVGKKTLINLDELICYLGLRKCDKEVI